MAMIEKVEKIIELLKIIGTTKQFLYKCYRIQLDEQKQFIIIIIIIRIIVVVVTDLVRFDSVR